MIFVVCIPFQSIRTGLAVIKLNRWQRDDTQISKGFFIVGCGLIFGPNDWQSLELGIVLDGNHFGFQGPAGSTKTGKKLDDDQLVVVGFNKVAVVAK